MGIFSWLGGDHTGEPAPVAGKKNLLRGEIAYDPGLIEQLKSDHADLVKVFTEISGAVNSRQYHEIPRLLGRFKVALQAHIMMENVKFYVYLQHKVSTDMETSAYVADLRKEMDGIARAVVKFANTHSSGALTDETAGTFAQQLNEIGEILLQRVQLEESRLYTLYTA